MRDPCARCAASARPVVFAIRATRYRDGSGGARANRRRALRCSRVSGFCHLGVLTAPQGCQGKVDRHYATKTFAAALSETPGAVDSCAAVSSTSPPHALSLPRGDRPQSRRQAFCTSKRSRRTAYCAWLERMCGVAQRKAATVNDCAYNAAGAAPCVLWECLGCVATRAGGPMQGPEAL